MRDLKFMYFLFLCASYITSVIGLGTRSGPFKCSFVRVGACPNPTLPIDPSPPAIFFAELYNSTTIHGKVTVVREHTVKKMKAKCYIWDNNKWKVNYMINNTGCNRVFFPILVIATGVKHNIRTCTFYKGEYAYDNLNLDMVEHVWMKTQEYGRVLWRLEFFSEAGTVFCWEFETLIEPTK